MPETGKSPPLVLGALLAAAAVDALVAYVRVLQGITSTGPITLPGDPHAGEALFFGQGSCSQCHMANGRGRLHGRRPLRNDEKQPSLA